MKFRIWHLLVLLLVVKCFLMFYPNDLVFDEYYYIPAARDMLSGVASNLEHPFLGKAFASLGIMAFGDNVVGWRLPYVLVGIAIVYVFYRIARRMFGEGMALYSTVLLAFDQTFFAHTNLALLEGPCLLFALLALYFYGSKRYYLTAVFLGLSFLGKEWGILFVLVLALYHLTVSRRITKKGILKTFVFLLILSSTILFPLWAYDLAYRPFSVKSIKVKEQYKVYTDAAGNEFTITKDVEKTIGRQILNPIDHLAYMIEYARSLNREGSDEYNQPWRWIVPKAMDPWIYYGADVVEEVGGIKRMVRSIYWYGVTIPVLWYTVWLLPLLAYRARRDRDSLFLTYWIGITCPIWFLAYGLGRIVYPFYMLNSLPALALGFSKVMESINPDLRDGVMSFLLSSELALFAYYFPVKGFRLL